MSTTPNSQDGSKPLTPQQKMMQARNARKQAYYQDKTPEQAQASAKQYQEKQKIAREINEENRKFEVQTDVAMQKLDQASKKQDAEYVHRLKLQAQLDKKRREEEEELRLARVEQLRVAREEKEKLEARKLAERQRAIIEGNYSRDKIDEQPVQPRALGGDGQPMVVHPPSNPNLIEKPKKFNKDGYEQVNGEESD